MTGALGSDTSTVDFSFFRGPRLIYLNQKSESAPWEGHAATAAFGHDRLPILSGLPCCFAQWFLALQQTRLQQLVSAQDLPLIDFCIFNASGWDRVKDLIKAAF